MSKKKSKPKPIAAIIDELLRDPDRPRASLTIGDHAAANKALRELLDVDGRRTNLNAILTQRVADLRDAFGYSYDELAGRSAALEAALEAFAVKDRDNWDGAKSLVLDHGTLQFHCKERAAVLLLNDKWTWDKVLDALKAAARALSRFARRKVTYSIAKNDVLAFHRDGKVTDQELASVGLRVDQPEQFRIVLHTEEAATTAR